MWCLKIIVKTKKNGDWKIMINNKTIKYNKMKCKLSKKWCQRCIKLVFGTVKEIENWLFLAKFCNIWSVFLKKDPFGKKHHKNRSFGYTRIVIIVILSHFTINVIQGAIIEQQDEHKAKYKHPWRNWKLNPGHEIETNRNIGITY